MPELGTLPEAVVVFGAGGFIGRNIVTALQGLVPLICGVTASGAPVAGCAVTVAVLDAESLPPLPRCAVLVNVAAARYDARNFAQRQAEILTANLALTEQVYRFALMRRITEIRAAGSSAVYPAGSPVMDDAQPLDLNAWPHAGEAAYAWSKRWGEITAELWHRQSGIHTLSFRLTNPYGPFDTRDAAAAHVATAFVLRALAKEPEFVLRGDPDAERDFVFAGDVSACFVASLRLRGVHDVVNCAVGRTTRIIELARTVLSVAGTERPIRIEPPPGAAGVKRRAATASRLHALLPGLPPFHTLEDGLRKTLAWYRDGLA